MQTNILGTLHVLNACLKSKITRIVHTSTSEVYGTARHVPITLDHPRQAQSPYAASKIAADALVISYARSFELPAVVLRPFNTFGPRQSPRAVIPTIVRQALAGGTVHIGSVHPSRDFLYVDDTVSGFIAAAASDLAPGTEVQIGTGVETRIGDVVGMTGRLLGKSLQTQSEDQRIRPDTSEVERLVCDYSEARRLMGWEPHVPFAEGLRRTIGWMDTHRAATEFDKVHEYVV